jgi:hypothetical protein
MYCGVRPRDSVMNMTRIWVINTPTFHMPYQYGLLSFAPIQSLTCIQLIRRGQISRILAFTTASSTSFEPRNHGFVRSGALPSYRERK